MKRFEQALSSVAVASVFCGYFGVACNVTPSVGSSGGAAGSAVAGAGGNASNAGGSSAAGQGGAGGSPVFVLPDALVAPADDAATEDVSAPASGDANCGSTQSKLEKKPADLLLVLDRSSSMGEAMDSAKNCSASSTTCSQRWATIIASLGKVLTSSSSDLNWGLKFFSSPTGGGGMPGLTGGNCNVTDGVEVPVGPGNSDKIQTQIAAAGNAGYTPTRAAIDAAVTYLKTVNDGNNKFILLATDGEPNCPTGQGSFSATSDLDATLTAVQNAVAAGYKVYVIGVGTETGNLTGLAQAGGTDKFYSALSPDDLTAALAAIVGTVTAGCTYELPSQPVAPGAVGVYVDKAQIPESDTDGWSYAPGSSTTINIHGSICDDLTSGKKTQVEIFLPCKESEPIPTIIP
jgi:Mg-chelatase subunit ChlD